MIEFWNVVDNQLSPMFSARGKYKVLRYDTNSKVFTELECLLSEEEFDIINRKDFVVFEFEDYLRIGRIEQIEKQDNELVNLWVSINNDLLEHDVFIGDYNKPSLEQFVADSLTSEFISNPLLKARVPLSIEVDTNTTGKISAPDKVLSLSVLTDQLMRIYNIKLECTFDSINRQIKAVIKKVERPQIKISELDGFVKKTNLFIDSENATKITVITDTGSYTYYLKSNGRITDDVNDPTIIDSVVDLKEYQADMTQSQAETLAKERLERIYNNKIEIMMKFEQFQLLGFDSWFDFLNADVLFYDRYSNKIQTKVSKLEIRNGDFVDVTLGTSRTRLTDKLKRR